MLNSLYIKNVAVIDKLEITFHNGMSVLTGETGAGKSIIIDSINMILGDRAKKELVRYGTEKAQVQAVFESNKRLDDILKQNDIDTEDGEVIITRTVFADGRSNAKINGMTVPLSILREAADCLINIHGQHDNQALLTPSKHIRFLDSYAKDEHELEDYKTLYNELKEIKSELDSLHTDEQEKIRKTDILKYQIDEIQKANISEGEEDDLKEQRDLCVNAEKLSTAIEEAYVNLYEGGQLQSAYDGISIAVSSLSDFCELSPVIKNAYDSISDAMYAIEDAAHELKSFGEDVYFDEQALDDIENRLELISRLKIKYGRNISEIKAFLEKSKAELNKIETSDERIEELEEKFKSGFNELKKKAAALTEKRKSAAKELAERIEQSLHELNMEKAEFVVSVEQNENGFSSNGENKVEMLISANPGEPPKPLVKIASGGELSRVMLAIKSIIASDDIVNTMIFDEIDTGVSGNTASKIAAKLSSIGKNKQVICITHLPQLTSCADHHYLISKNTDGTLASTTVKELDRDGRIGELARMIDGEKITKTALEHAKELLERKGE